MNDQKLKKPSKFWCYTCTHKKRDRAIGENGTWYCPEIVTWITRENGIWCTTWRCGCTLHSGMRDELKEHDAAIRNAVLDEVMEKIDYRFNDTERGRRTIETCREVIKSLRGKL